MTDYAVVLLARMASSDGLTTAPALAAASGLPEPSVGKILKQLARARLVRAQRGAAGGYVLARPAADIRISEVVAALEGEIALTACVDGAEGLCQVETSCPVRGRWDPVNRAVRAALDAVSLADMAGLAAPAMPPGRLETIAAGFGLPGQVTTRRVATKGV